MTQEELSERIIDGNFSTDLSHEDDSDELEHYGVLGMKWGIRKDRKRKGESDVEYQNRIRSQADERQKAHEIQLKKIEAKSRAQEQKRTLKSQAKASKAQAEIRKKELKLQESREKTQRKNQEEQAKARKKELRLQKEREEAQRKQQKEQQKLQEQQRREQGKKKTKAKDKRDVTELTDQELNDIINRIQREQTYKNLTKGPGSKLIDKGMRIVNNVSDELMRSYIKNSGAALIDKGIEKAKKNKAKK